MWAMEERDSLCYKKYEEIRELWGNGLRGAVLFNTFLKNKLEQNI